jgi:hypothetical protein
MSFRDVMTDEMLAVIASVDADAKVLAIKLYEMALQAKKAGEISLPRINQRGTAVVHGCRLEMFAAMDRLQVAAKQLTYLLDWDEGRALRDKYEGLL